MEYVNRQGNRYYVFQGTTKAGKPKFYVSKRPQSNSGSLVKSLPPEFELHESPSDGRVSVRRRRTSNIIPPERDLVHQLAETLSAYSQVQTLIEGDRIVVYTPAVDAEHAAELMDRLFGHAAVARLADWTQRNTHYNAELRFSLADAEKRTYVLERYCYRGSIDDWITIGGPDLLETLAEKILPHLGHDSFFDYRF